MAKDNRALFKVKKLVISSLNKFLLKNKNIAVKKGRKIGGSKGKKSKKGFFSKIFGSK